ncbi:MAG TPA: hypothetical protein VIU64_05845, partial [Polyangia bacterium]
MSPANVIFIVGRNQSMGTSFGDLPRITAVTRAIQSAIGMFPNAVYYAYAEYPSRIGCSGTNSCCVSSDSWYSVGLLNENNDSKLSCDPGPQNSSCLVMTDGRPITPTLAQTAQWLGPGTTNERYAILFADGPPGGCPGDNATDACNAAVMSITNLRQSAGVSS